MKTGHSHEKNETGPLLNTIYKNLDENIGENHDIGFGNDFFFYDDKGRGKNKQKNQTNWLHENQEFIHRDILLTT